MLYNNKKVLVEKDLYEVSSANTCQYHRRDTGASANTEKGFILCNQRNAQIIYTTLLFQGHRSIINWIFLTPPHKKTPNFLP